MLGGVVSVAHISTGHTIKSAIFIHLVYFLLPRYVATLKSLSIGTLKTIDIPYIPNGKLIFVGILVFKRIIIGL